MMQQNFNNHKFFKPFHNTGRFFVVFSRFRSVIVSAEKQYSLSDSNNHQSGRTRAKSFIINVVLYVNVLHRNQTNYKTTGTFWLCDQHRALLYLFFRGRYLKCLFSCLPWYTTASLVLLTSTCNRPIQHYKAVI